MTCNKKTDEDGCLSCENHDRCAEEPDWVYCGCCGKSVANNAKSNAHYGREPYPDDNGYGMCRECGGDPRELDRIDHKDEPALRKALGWTTCCIVDSRIEVLRKNLNEKNKEKFESLNYAGKANIIFELMEQGAIF